MRFYEFGSGTKGNYPTLPQYFTIGECNAGAEKAQKEGKGSCMSIYGWDSRFKNKAKNVIGGLVFEMDCSEDPQKSFNEAVKIVRHFEQVYKVPKEQFEIYFSGNKSPHLIIPPEVFGIEPMPKEELVLRYKTIAEKVKEVLKLETLDPVPIGRGMLRMVGFKHEGTGLYKIPLTYEELKEGYEKAKELAIKPRVVEFAEPKTSKKAKELFSLPIKESKSAMELNPLTEPNEDWQKSYCLRKVLSDSDSEYNLKLAISQAILANFKGNLDKATDFLLKYSTWAKDPVKTRYKLSGLKYFPKKDRLKTFCKDCERCTLYPKLIVEFNEDRRLGRAMVSDQLLEKNNFVTHQETETLYIYNSGVYRPNGEQFVKSQCQNIMGRIATTYDIKEISETIKRSTYRPEEDFDRPATKISLLNGTLNLETLLIEPHSSNFLSRSQVPVIYNPEADCPEIKQFLNEVVKKEDIPLLVEYIGYCLWKDYPFHKALFLVGDGANGKSTLLNMVVRFLGEENLSHIQLQELSYNKFATARLVGKLANIFPDLPSKKISSTGMFKAVTGGDRIHVEQKFKDGYNYKNYAKQLFSCNQIPEVEDETSAMFRRPIIINCPNLFDGTNRDEKKLEKITTPEEMSGFLNLAIGGLKRLQENHGFSYSKSTEETRDQWQRASSPISAFAKDCLEKDLEAEVPKDKMYRAFTKYCNVENIPVQPKNIFGTKIQQYADGIHSTHPRFESKQVWCWKGYKLLKDPDKLPANKQKKLKEVCE